MSRMAYNPVTVSRIEAAMNYDFARYTARMSRHKRPALNTVRLAAAYAVMYQGRSMAGQEFADRLGFHTEGLWRILGILRRAGMTIYRSKGMVHIEDASLRWQA